MLPRSGSHRLVKCWPKSETFACSRCIHLHQYDGEQHLLVNVALSGTESGLVILVPDSTESVSPTAITVARRSNFDSSTNNIVWFDFVGIVLWERSAVDIDIQPSKISA